MRRRRIRTELAFVSLNWIGTSNFFFLNWIDTRTFPLLFLAPWFKPRASFSRKHLLISARAPALLPTIAYLLIFLTSSISTKTFQSQSRPASGDGEQGSRGGHAEGGGAGQSEGDCGERGPGHGAQDD